ncbi:hypothetical protein Patl1_13991 [Pistacia atlantica]|uniref:Uncharacterized protein n=1 Tax=Pistacia atlantica TaxID=434234 RepID=A0ACC1AXN6_9ROSI|nr:hypothetical protein Patl1_13991 [Pistacia atlantica]
MALSLGTLIQCVEWENAEDENNGAIKTNSKKAEDSILKDQIRYMLKLLRPNSLIEAIGLAHTQKLIWLPELSLHLIAVYHTECKQLLAQHQEETVPEISIHAMAGAHLLKLWGGDAVLGAHWHQTLGPILWDFNKIRMKFTFSGNHHQILGEPLKKFPTQLATLSPSLVRHLILVIYSFPLLQVDLTL